VIKYISANAVGIITSVLVLVIIRYCFGTKDLIVYTEMWAVGSLLSLILPFGIDRAILRFNRVERYASNIEIASTIILVLSIIALICVFCNTYESIILVVGISRATTTIYLSLTNAYDKKKSYLIKKILDGLVRVIAVGVIVLIGESIRVYLTSSSILTIIVVFILLKGKVKFHVTAEVAKEYFKYGIPLAVSALVVTGLPHLDRIMGSFSNDNFFLELLSVAGPIITGLYALQAGVYSWYIPKFNRLYSENSCTNLLVKRYVLVSLLISVLSVPIVLIYIRLFSLANVSDMLMIKFALALSISFAINAYTNVFIALLMMNNKQLIFSGYATTLGIIRIVGFGLVSLYLSDLFYLVYPVYALMCYSLYKFLARNIEFSPPKLALIDVKELLIWKNFI
jgi:hypothetical protein